MDMLAVVHIYGRPDDKTLTKRDELLKQLGFVKVINRNSKRYELPSATYAAQNSDIGLDCAVDLISEKLRALKCMFQIFIVEFDKFCESNCRVEESD